MAIICGVILLMVTIMFIIFSTPAFKDVLVESIKDGTSQTSFGGTPEHQADATQIMFIIMAVSFGLAGGVELASAIISFKAISNPSENAFVLAIVFGSLSGTAFPIVGGIFGLIVDAKEKRKAEKLAINE